jgi:hypothetical protein
MGTILKEEAVVGASMNKLLSAVSSVLNEYFVGIYQLPCFQTKIDDFVSQLDTAEPFRFKKLDIFE